MPNLPARKAISLPNPQPLLFAVTVPGISTAITASVWDVAAGLAQLVAVIRTLS